MRAFIIALAAVAFIPALAHAQSSLNNEAVCSSPGYSMDPRCVGGSSPSTETFIAPQQRGLILVQPTQRRR